MTTDATATGIGVPVKRKEDIRFLRGEGRYVADVTLPDALHAAIVRSDRPHARIRSIDTARASALPGVVAVVTAADLGDLGKIPVRSHPMPQLIPFLQHPLARHKVHYVGDPVAVVVAVDRHVAEDAVALVDVDYEPLQPLVDVEEAMAPGAPLLFEDQGTNVVASFGEEVGDVDAVFAAAHTVVSHTFRIQRHGAVPLEPRGVVARHDPVSGVLTVWGPTKVLFGNRGVLAKLLDFPEERIRFVEPDVGGGFGARGEVYPEDILVPALALRLGRPVKWVEDRRENLVAMNQSREQVHHAELAVSEEGELLGLRSDFVNVMGGYIRTHGIRVPEISARIFPGPYRIPAYRCRFDCVLTNKVPVGTYRAPGRFEVNFVRERLIDLAAARLGLTPVEIRRRNLVTADDMPHDLGTYDRGEPVVFRDVDAAATLERALELCDHDALRARRDAARAQGRRVGVGIACYMEESGLGGSAPGEFARVAIQRSGEVILYTGATSLGQGHETMLAQVVGDELGVDYRRVAVVHGDTDRVPWGGGTFADRGAIVAANAAALAARRLKARCQEVAALLAEPGRTLSLGELAEATYGARMAELDREPGLEASAMFYVTEHTYAPGTHIACVEVDSETGTVDVLEYTTVHDVGRALNPALVEGQLVGGVAQGIGGALLEEFHYDEDCRPLTTTFRDYLLPSAMEMPATHRVLVLEEPSSLNPLGTKGAGDAGPAGAGAAIANAVADALDDVDAPVTALPLTPGRVLDALAAGVTVGGSD